MTKLQANLLTPEAYAGRGAGFGGGLQMIKARDPESAGFR